MSIPKEILAVQRPVNTVVIAYGKNKNLYAVRQRVGCRNINGRHLPINGPTIGHIVDGSYIPIKKATSLHVSALPIDLKDWANIALSVRVFKNVLDELLNVYSYKDSLKIYCISILRVCNPEIKHYELEEAYETSFLSEIYPGVALSKNTVSKFLNNLGKTCSKIRAFMKSRTEQIALDHHILIDGTLKSNESIINSLSDFSRKARTKGTRDISVLYAFDLESMEPICSKCFPGNMLDVTSYEAFIKENHITKGIVVANKGFPSSAAKLQSQENPNLHYLNPIKRNSTYIDRYNLLDFNNILCEFEGITYRKEKCIDTNKWLYSFRDAKRAAKEEQDWLKHAKEHTTYGLDTLRKKQFLFGTVILESDLDLPSETVYKAYGKRWEIEIVMRYYKSACSFDETHVQDDYSVIGSEFCDFLSTVLTFRLIKAFDKVKLLEQMTYKKIMSILMRAKKIQQVNKEWDLIRLNPSHMKVLQELELVPWSEEEPKKKRGRPKKNVIV